MVKVRERKPQRKTALVSLIMAVVAALLTFAGWRAWQADKSAVAKQRDIRDVVVTWECPSGERFEAPGGCVPLPCPQEGQTADIVLLCECPQHGQFECYARYQPDEAWRARLSEARFRDGPWEPVDDGICCPQCGRRARCPPDVDWPSAGTAHSR